MPSRINTNMPAIDAQRNLGNTQNQLTKDLQKLSSGLRINSAADDASGLAISSRMQGQLGGFKAATSNTNDAIALIQTADGALSGINAMLQRMRELAVRASSGTVDAVAGAINQSEITLLQSNITATVGVTQYNTIPLLDGSANLIFQVGANNTVNDQFNLVIPANDVASIGVDQIDVTTNSNAQAAIATIDAGIIYVAQNRALLGAAQNIMERTAVNLGITIENTAASLSNIMDADMADLMVDYTKSNILFQAAESMLGQANQLPNVILGLLRG